MQRRFSQLQTARACKVLGSDLQNRFGDEQVPDVLSSPSGGPGGARSAWFSSDDVLEDFAHVE
jgi:hypothetical protein